MRAPWVMKHRPKRVDDVVNQEEAKRALGEWLKEWLSGRIPKTRALLLHGPPGSGKTSLVEAFARELGLEVLELNASDSRRREDLLRTVGVAAQRKPLIGKRLLILLDEVDGIDPRADEGGIEVLSRIIESSKNPIIMTANDPWKESLRPLRPVAQMVQFKELTEAQMVSLLKRICERERLSCEEEALRIIARRSMGDARAAINDLQAIAEGVGAVSVEVARDMVKAREKSINIWRTLNEVFYADQAWMSKRAVSQSEVDYETLFLWIAENVWRKYKSPRSLFRAYEALSRASVFLQRARRTGEWGMLVYVFDLMGPGVTFARGSEEVSKERYSSPDILKLKASSRESREIRDSIARRLASRLSVSLSTAVNEVLPYVGVIFRSGNPKIAAGIARAYGFTEDMIRYLARERSEEVIKIMRGGGRRGGPAGI